MTPPADKPMDRREAVILARWWLENSACFNMHTTDILARAVLAMDEELRKAAESGKEKP